MKILASEITAWRYCPRQLYKVKILGEERPLNEDLVKGSLLHLVYKEFFDRKPYTSSSYIEWFLDKGIERVMEKEDGKINKLNMSRELLKDFLVYSAQGLNAAFNKGRISVPKAIEQHIESDEFIARVDAIFEKDEHEIIGDIKKRIRNLDEVKLQLTVAAIIFDALGKKVERGLAIDAENWREIEFLIDNELKQEVWKIREEILQMYETREAPECKCGRCK